MFVQIHVVKKGDTLWNIAKQYGIGFEELKALNSHLANPDYIVPGMEIMLPDNATKAKSMTKEQKTAPIQSIDKSNKQKMTEEIKPIEKELPMPEMPETPELVEPVEQVTPEVTPMPQQPQVQFQPQPMPMPMPIPMPMPMQQPAPQPLQIHPIIIDWPQQQPKQESPEKPIVEKEIEFVPQPQYIYVPCMPPQPMYSPCGCEPMYQPMNPNPCGCNDVYPAMQQGYPYGYEQMQPMQSMNPCGCGSPDMMQYPYQQQMPFEQQYFEPNYDILPVTEDCSQDETLNKLPDWLKDSSKFKEELSHSHGKTEFSNEMCPEKEAQIADYYNQMHHLEQVTGPLAEGYGQGECSPMPMHMPQMEHMHYMQHMQQMPYLHPMYQMPYPMQQHGAQNYPNLNHHSTSQSKPWSY